MRRGIWLLAVIPLAAVVGCGSPNAGTTPVSAGSSQPTIGGTFEIRGTGNYTTTGTSCTGNADAGFGDITSVTEVTLYDQSSTVIAAAQLGDGSPDRTSCDFSFTFGAVKPGAEFYSVEVGQRGKFTESASQLADGAGQFNLWLGP